MSAVLEMQKIFRSYQRGKPVLKGVDLSVKEGEVVGLLGRNGAGKTTLIRVAMGMLYPDSGEVRVFDLSPTKDAVAVKKRVGYVAEDQVLPGTSKISELIAFHRYLFPRWDEAWERQMLERFSLNPNSRIGTLSKGQARQVALMLALCHRPDLLLLDEPGGGLDPAARREFLEASVQLLNREGAAILFSSHHMNDVERIGERVVFLDEGVVRLDRGIDSLREDFCIAMVSKRAAPDVSAVARTPGCLRTRSVGEDWHALFEGPPEEVARRLGNSLGADDVRCVRAPLEELFIELVGGER